ncbi:hypothetical protein J5N97_003496 [Dioscorea zingiberensis]|uniref:Glycosyltransferase n=1 Tax=Dioscorea zingiberensis TaxID=325984 RepID=A0A9D5HQ49_9LILI|nr:hypothetical protein J5N97_003496 [Dioscorea zingiberensis]
MERSMKRSEGEEVERPHAVCLPMPAQGHLNPMMVLSTFLHSHGFTITFIHTDFDRSRLLRSGGPAALRSTETFRYASFPDGLPPSDIEGNRHTPASGPKVTLLVWDGITSFGRRAAEALGIPNVMFWTASAAGLLSYLHFPELVARGIAPLKDESYLSNGYLESRVDWIPGMKDITLRDLPGVLRTTDPDDIMFNFVKDEAMSAHEASAIFINTFDELELEVLTAMASKLPPIHPIGPLSLLLPNHQAASMASNLWKEDGRCMEWLDQREAESVVYVNFGSVINLTVETFKEFAWGLVDSKQYFLWVIRPDLVPGSGLPEEFWEAARGRGLVVEWCSQREVLMKASVGAFVTHCGWNSVLEAIAGGVPMLCWPAFAEQTTNCYYACKKWGVGVEIGEVVRREEVTRLVVEVMEGEKGKEMKKKAAQWKEKAHRTIKAGSSFTNINRLLLV